MADERGGTREQLAAEAAAVEADFRELMRRRTQLYRSGLVPDRPAPGAPRRQRWAYALRPRARLRDRLGAALEAGARYQGDLSVMVGAGRPHPAAARDSWLAWNEAMRGVRKVDRRPFPSDGGRPWSRRRRVATSVPPAELAKAAVEKLAEPRDEARQATGAFLGLAAVSAATGVVAPLTYAGTVLGGTFAVPTAGAWAVESHNLRRTRRELGLTRADVRGRDGGAIRSGLRRVRGDRRDRPEREAAAGPRRP
ncbi:MAG TPA: hypothetical protein VF053_20215 [Streptosporangiales bacterium]